jgi:hypothetical protein
MPEPQAVKVAVPKSRLYPQGVKQYSLEEIASMPMQRYMVLQDRIVNARSQVYYDTVRLESGSAWVRGQSARLFTKGIDQDGRITNTGAVVTKSKFDTNMVQDGAFEFGVTAIVSAIEAHIVLPARAATADVQGMITNPAPAAKAANVYSSSILLYALTHQVALTFFRGEDSEENGLLYQFPSRHGLSASYGGDVEEGFAQNSMGHGSKLDFPKVLVHDENFNVLIEQLSDTLALPVDAAIRINLMTKRIGRINP